MRVRPLGRVTRPPHKPGVVLLLTRPHGKMAAPDRFKSRGARVADSACLESTCAGNGTVGSNPHPLRHIDAFCEL